MKQRADGSRVPLALWALVAVLGVGLVAFSQAGAWYPDEGFHLLAAKLINAGKRPYVDFFYQHPPLYAYVNAGWMRVVGESWRSAHLLSALLTSVSVALVAGFVDSRLRGPGWGLAGAGTAALLVGLHLLVIRFGTIGQPYALCLALSVAAFRLVTAVPDRPRGRLSFWAGLCAGGAAASSLLAAPVGPVLLVWLWRQGGSGQRWKKAVWFAGGGMVPFLPLLWLAVQAPRATLFNVVEYQLFHRWPAPAPWAVARNNLAVLTEWLQSPQAFLLGLLAAVGVLFLTQRGEWDPRRLAELRLCAWLALGVAVVAALPRPTYVQYFVLLVPFLAILAAVGVYAIGSRLWSGGRPAWVTVAVLGLFVLGLSKTAFHERRALERCWPVIEEIAREVNRVTPIGGLVYADDYVYFAAGRLPPRGLENYNARLPRLPADLAAAVGVVPESRIEEWLASGRFATVVFPAEGREKVPLGLWRLYARQRELPPCYHFSGYMFWEKVARLAEVR